MSNALGTPPGSDPVERFLNRISSFETLEPDARDALWRAMTRGPLLPPLQQLHPDPLQDVSVLLSGWMCHFRLLDNGRRQVTSVVLPGDFVDFGFLSGASAPLQCVTMAPSQLGRIRVRQFMELAEEYPTIMRAILRASAIDAAISHERIISLGVRTATERLSHFLCELWYRLSAVGLVSTDGSYELPMTQSELGAVLGLSTVHVNRTIQVLRKSGAVRLQGGKVWIGDLGHLTTLAGFDPAFLGIPN